MGFKDQLIIRSLGDFLTSLKARALLYFVGDDDTFRPVSRSNPVPVEVTNLSSGGGGSDPASAREVTLGQVRDRLPANRAGRVIGRQILPLSAVAQGLTLPAGAIAAEIGVSGGTARVAIASPDPTATAGRVWGDGTGWRLHDYELTPFRAIIASGAPVLDITYLGTVT